MAVHTKRARARSKSERDNTQAVAVQEEIEIKLGPSTAEPDQLQQTPGDGKNAAAEWQQEIAESEKAGNAGMATRTVAGNEQAPKKELTHNNEGMRKDVQAQLWTAAHVTLAGVIVETTVKLFGADAIRFTHEKTLFQLAWSARRLADGVSFNIGTIVTELAPNQLQYGTTSKVANLQTGTYRLATVITFPTTRQLVASYQGPIIQINAG